MTTETTMKMINQRLSVVPRIDRAIFLLRSVHYMSFKRIAYYIDCRESFVRDRFWITAGYVCNMSYHDPVFRLIIVCLIQAGRASKFASICRRSISTRLRSLLAVSKT